MSMLKNKHTSNQLKDLREAVKESKLSVDEAKRELYRTRSDCDSSIAPSVSEERVKELKDIISKIDREDIIKSAKDMGVEVKSNSKIGR